MNNKTKNAIYSLDKFDIEQLFIDNDFEDLNQQPITLCLSNELYITGSCTSKDYPAERSTGEWREDTPGYTEMTTFDITGEAWDSETEEYIKFVFNFMDKKPIIKTK